MGGAASEVERPRPRLSAVSRSTFLFRRVQDRLGRRILLENPSIYLAWSASTIPEPEFLAALAELGNTAEDSRSLLHTALQHIKDALGLEAGGFYLPRPDGEKLEIVVRMRDIELPDEVNELDAAGPLVAQVMDAGRAIFFDDMGMVDDSMPDAFRELARAAVLDRLPRQPAAARSTRTVAHPRGSTKPPPPWLGVHADETHGRVFIIRLTPGGPAEKAGIKVGDIILTVDQTPVKGLADFFRQIGRLGPAGVKVPLSILQETQVRRISVQSADRYQFLQVSRQR